MVATALNAASRALSKIIVIAYQLYHFLLDCIMRRPGHARPMIVIPGRAALSAGRLAKRLAKIQSQNPALSALSARFVHFVDLGDAELSEDERRLLERLLEYGPRDDGRRALGRALLRRAALGHDFAVGVQGDRHRQDLRAAPSATHRARHRVRRAGFHPRRSGARARLARSHDRVGAAQRAGSASSCSPARSPSRCRSIDLLGLGRSAIEDANRSLGLALAADEIEYLEQSYRALVA